MHTDRIAARQFPVWSFIHEEMLERGWDKDELAIRMTGNGDARDIAVTRLTLDLLEVSRDNGVFLGETTAASLAYAFGTSKDIWINLDNSYRLWRKVNPTAQGGV